MFSKWQEFLDKSDELNQRQQTLEKMQAELAARENELASRAQELETKSKRRRHSEGSGESGGDSIQSVFLISEREAQLKHRESLLDLR
jgi:Skp family chaperone for outer membrane proteins